MNVSREAVKARACDARLKRLIHVTVRGGCLDDDGALATGAKVTRPSRCGSGATASQKAPALVLPPAGATGAGRTRCGSLAAFLDGPGSCRDNDGAGVGVEVGPANQVQQSDTSPHHVGRQTGAPYQAKRCIGRGGHPGRSGRDDRDRRRRLG